jgi:hypothetical protein
LGGPRPLPDDAEAMITREAAGVIGVTRQNITTSRRAADDSPMPAFRTRAAIPLCRAGSPSADAMIRGHDEAGHRGRRDWRRGFPTGTVGWTCRG